MMTEICRICEEEGEWCYVTGFGYACRTCRRRAAEEEKEQEQKGGDEHETS